MKALSRLVLIILIAMVAGCGGKHSKTTDTDSTGFSALAEKQAFLEQYVTFRRSYEELEFDISFTDGGDGMTPGPSEWDIRVLAKVPIEDLDEWISGMRQTEVADTSWVSTIPNAPTKLDAFQWHEDGGRLVGTCPADQQVLYRNLAH